MRRSNRGFSLVELVIVILIGAIMTSIVIRGFGNTRAGNSVRSAEQNFRGLHAQARAYAIERGNEATLVIEPDQDQVLIRDADGDTVEIMDFFETLGVDIRSSGTVELTFTARGYADVPVSADALTDIAFVQESEERIVSILPIGQLKNE